jgi:hypothetical protein
MMAKTYTTVNKKLVETENVEVKYDRALPFNSPWSEDQIQPVLITAIRR